MVGFERLYKDGMLGVVHGCGYDHPSLSHFSSMGFWHTGVPNGGDPLGWLGRLADRTYDTTTRNMIVNVGNSQSLAVRSARDASAASHPFRAITIATFTRPPDATNARSALSRDTPATSAISLSARSRSLADRGCRSTMRLP
jgi:uncharacterized protein (DUF1501 family)